MREVVFSRPDMQGSLEEFALIPRSTLGHLTRELPQGSDVRRLLVSSWTDACAAGEVVEDAQSVSFPLGERAVSSRYPLVATLKPNTHNPKQLPWAVTYAGPDSHHVLGSLEDDAQTPRSLLAFAYIPWTQLIQDVQERALPETWGFGEDDASILRSYLTNTYQRLSVQDKVLVSAGEGFAAFNTGLVTPTYDDLYLCFTPNVRPRPAWCYAGLCVAGEKGLGKRLAGTFAKLPTVATYVDNVSDLVMDDVRELYTDERHILIDNIDRLPLPFLREELHDQPQMLSQLDSIARLRDDHPAESEDADEPNGGRLGDEDARGEKHKELDAAYDELRSAIEESTPVFRRLKNTLRDAIDHARKRTRWNYRTAIPCYHPTTDQMSLLIPLCLQEGSTPDVALVVSLRESGNYQGETILTMHQAYLDARLICRPEEDWLTAR